MTAHAVRVLCLTILAGSVACEGTGGRRSSPAPDQPAIAATTAALTVAERTHTARAAFWTSEAARYRQVAAQLRQLAAADAQRARPTAVAAERVAKREAAAEGRAAAADQIAARLQPIIDYHTAEAAMEGTR